MAATAVLLTFLLVGATGLQGASASEGGAPVPLAAEMEIFYEGFESSGIPAPWTVGDGNLSYGEDTWGISGTRADVGNGSAWVATSGSHTDYTVVIDEDFETGALSSAWTVEDTNGADGYDYWGISTARGNGSSNYSVWCAQVGTHSQYGQPNAGLGFHDDYMDAYIYQDVVLTGLTNIVFEFAYWYNTENRYDYFRPSYYDGSWVQLQNQDGSSGGWQTGTETIPSTATRVGFWYHSDVSVQREGAYVDDITLIATITRDNTQTLLYDNGMDSNLSRPVDASAFETARLEYSYWLESQTGQDFLEVLYFDTNWTTVATYDASSGGWTTAAFSLPVTATAIRFRFTSDDAGRLEGAYIDEVRVIGSVSPPSCSAIVSADTGIERDTVFYFDGSAVGGYGVFTYLWTFGDGTNSTQLVPSHTYQDVGTYTARLVVTDGLGQTCIVDVPGVTIDYDLSEIHVSPVASEMMEGTSREFNAETRYGHALDFNWSINPANCGQLLGSPGPRATFDAGEDEGDNTCTIIASYGSGSGSVGVSITHDLRLVVVDPASATVFVSYRVPLSATDRFDHPYFVEWWTTCGRVLPDQGETAVFTAITSAGSTCVVTAERGSARTTVPIQVQQDPSNMAITPSEAHVVEGAGVSFEAEDSFGKPMPVDWTVTPDTCGELTIAHGPSTTLQTGQDTGGTSCRVTGGTSGHSRNATVIVVHDLTGGALTLSAESVVGGDEVAASAADKYGHPLSVDWMISPSTCGVFSSQSGDTTTLEVDLTTGDVICTLTASTETLTLHTLVSVELGAPASIEVTFSGPAPEGSEARASAKVTDAGGHELDASGVSWTTTCAGLSVATGATTSVTAPETGAGSTCAVTASVGGVSGTGDLEIAQGPLSGVEIRPSTISVAGNGRVELSVVGFDSSGNEATPSDVTWRATCGHFEGEGATVTFVAPPDASAGACEITAELGGSSVGVTAASSVAVSAGLDLMVLLGVAAAAAAGVAALLMMRRKRPGDDGLEAPEETPETQETPQEPPERQEAPEEPGTP